MKTIKQQGVNMRKFLTIIFLSSYASCQAHYGQNDYQQSNSLTARYLRHEISTDEYVDSYVPKSNAPQIQTIYHSDGSRSYIKK